METFEEIKVRMMSGEVLSFPRVGSLKELQVLVAEKTRTPVEFLQLVQGEHVLQEPIDCGLLAEAETFCILSLHTPAIIKVLRQNGFNFRGLNEHAAGNPKGLRGCNLLHAAVLCGRLEIVRFLLDEEDFNGINNRLTCGGEHNAIHLAAQEGQVQICRELLSCERFTAANLCTEYEGTALHLAAKHGKLEVLRVLLDSERFTAVNETIPNQTGPMGVERIGRTALHVAAAHGQTEAAQVLLDHHRFTKVGLCISFFGCAL